jgi:hypothetical protein
MDPRRNDKNDIKKEPHGVREAREETFEEIHSGSTKPRIENPNRDRARGDWDRSGNHQDQGTSRAEDDPDGKGERA